MTLGDWIRKWGLILKNGQAMTQQEAIDFCRERIAKYKIPKSIHFVDKLPKTAGGKIRKYVLR
jgi:acyl-coenzyme A synthetase/AMP-(fatty) acid ligase